MGKKLVDSDFKNNRVEDPTKISTRQEQHVKQFVKAYFEKAVAKRDAHEKKKAERQARKVCKGAPSTASLYVARSGNMGPDEQNGAEHGMDMSDDEGNETKPGSATPNTPASQVPNGDALLKRKRHQEDEVEGIPNHEQATPTKRLKSETPPPPPPPPPPAEQIFSIGEAIGPARLANSEIDSEDIIRSLGPATFAHGDALPNRTTVGGSPVNEDDDSPEHRMAAGQMVESMEYSPASVSTGQPEDADSISPEFGLMNERRVEASC